MKKVLTILCIGAMALSMSVAANSLASRTQVCVVDDLGDTKVVKKSEIVGEITFNAYENMQIVSLDHAVILENEITVVNKPVSLSYNEVKPNKTKKIYILNCSILQFSPRTVAAG